ncbi:MAG: TonB-dependent receptor [Halioglobus sp.]
MLVLASAISSQVQAQAIQLEEVIVTAQKRSQSLQDVPISVQAIDSDQLQQNSVTELSDLARLAPGLSLANTQSAPGAGLGLRGVSTSTLGVGTENSTAIYVDGVYQPGPSAIARLVDIAQVEVLRGPQGTLFGRNAAAGAVNIRTVTPSENFEGFVSGTLGNFNLTSGSAVLNIPVNEVLRNRTSLVYRKRDGWQTDTDSAGADDLYEQDGYSIRNRLQWLPSDELTADLILHYSDESGTRGGYVVEEAASSDPGAGFSETHRLSGDEASASGLLFQDGELVAGNADLDLETFGASLELSWDFSDHISFSLISSYQESDRLITGTSGGLFSLAEGVFPHLPGYVGPERYEFESFNQEFRINGSSDSVDWFVGANYYSGTTNQTINLALPLFQTIDFATGELGDAQSIAQVDVESYAFFADFIFALSDRLNLTLGGRYSYDEKDVAWDDVAQGAPDVFYPDVENGFLVGTGFRAQADDDWDNFSGRLVLDYAIFEDVMMYGSASQGYKSGGFNTELSPGADPNDTFEPEESISYELGLKGSLLESSLQFSAAAFYTEYSDYQFQAAAPGAIAAVNLGADAEIQGVELEASWLALEGLIFSASVSYLDAEFSETVEITGPAGTEVAVEEGTEMIRAPQWAALAAIDYTHELGRGELRFNASYSYSDSSRLTSDSPQSLLNNGIDVTESDLYSGSYGLLNSRITYSPVAGNWEVSIWGKNLTDESYRDASWIGVANAVYGELGGGILLYNRNEPRTYGMDLRYNF